MILLKNGVFGKFGGAKPLFFRTRFLENGRLSTESLIIDVLGPLPKHKMDAFCTSCGFPKRKAAIRAQ